MSRRFRFAIPLFLIGAVVFVLSLLTVWSPSFRINVVEATGQTVFARLHAAPTEPFPNVPLEGLDDTQLRMISIAKQEYVKKPVSFNDTVMKYSQGNKESWCADFVSWVLLQSGQPLENPNSDNWRIPGTATMQEYYKSINMYQKAGQYTPQVGDIAIYRQNRSHVNLVIAVNGNMMTTIGGNETGHLRINTQSFRYGTQGLSGFGLYQTIK